MIITRELRKKFVKELDGYILLPAYMEPFDGPFLNQAIKYLDKNYGDSVPEQFKADITEAIECFIAKDWEKLLEIIPNVTNKIVDIPGLDEDTEGKFIAINMKAAFEFIEYLAKKNIK